MLTEGEREKIKPLNLKFYDEIMLFNIPTGML